MTLPENIDHILAAWPYDPQAVSVRLLEGQDGREVIQMRIEMGIMQLETTGRPDGACPEDNTDTYLEYLIGLELEATEPPKLTEEQCFQCDREFVQYYHRRICWLALQNYGKAVEDADHTLRLMDACRRLSPDEQWTMSHEQYRPFVMYHRIQAQAMFHVENDRHEVAVNEINNGLNQLRGIFEEHGVESDFEDDELVERLTELRESLRDRFQVGKTLREQLADAVASEKYELAARLRDELHKRRQM